MKKIIILLMGWVCLATPAFALDIKQAKEQGLVGERNDGYVGYVVGNPSNEVSTVVKSVNNKRKLKFEETAAKTGATVDQVKSRFYERAVQATKPNHYYQDQNGQWVKK